MTDKVVDLQRIRAALAVLDAVAAEHPSLRSKPAQARLDRALQTGEMALDPGKEASRPEE